VCLSNEFCRQVAKLNGGFELERTAEFHSCRGTDLIDNRDAGPKRTTTMSNTSSAEKARQERRIRSVGYLKALGVERTSAILIAAVAVLLFALVSILTSEGPATTEADGDKAAATETVAESRETLVIPQ
jgi:hypothetical protein